MNGLLVASPACFQQLPAPHKNPASLNHLTPYSGHFHVFSESVLFAGKAFPPCPFAPPPFNL